jgi:hypothetical protein
MINFDTAKINLKILKGFLFVTLSDILYLADNAINR